MSAGGGGLNIFVQGRNAHQEKVFREKQKGNN